MALQRSVRYDKIDWLIRFLRKRWIAVPCGDRFDERVGEAVLKDRPWA
jgi:hypothetical protein